MTCQFMCIPTDDVGDKCDPSGGELTIVQDCHTQCPNGMSRCWETAVAGEGPDCGGHSGVIVLVQTETDNCWFTDTDGPHTVMGLPIGIGVNYCNKNHTVAWRWQMRIQNGGGAVLQATTNGGLFQSHYTLTDGDYCLNESLTFTFDGSLECCPDGWPETLTVEPIPCP
jgi:hypothetical protein